MVVSNQFYMIVSIKYVVISSQFYLIAYMIAFIKYVALIFHYYMNFYILKKAEYSKSQQQIHNKILLLEFVPQFW